MKYSIKELETIDFGQSENGDWRDVVFEVIVESHFRSLKIHNKWYYLNLPRMIFLIESTKIYKEYTFRCNSVLTGVLVSEDEYIDCPLPNIFKSYDEENGYICLGEDISITSDNPKGIIDRILSSFYCSAFKNTPSDIGYNGPSSHFYEQWQKEKTMPRERLRRPSSKIDSLKSRWTWREDK
jgi:hypothetical protein